MHFQVLDLKLSLSQGKQVFLLCLEKQQKPLKPLNITVGVLCCHTNASLCFENDSKEVKQLNKGK